MADPGSPASPHRVSLTDEDEEGLSMDDLVPEPARDVVDLHPVPEPARDVVDLKPVENKKPKKRGKKKTKQQNVQTAILKPKPTPPVRLTANTSSRKKAPQVQPKQQQWQRSSHPIPKHAAPFKLPEVHPYHPPLQHSQQSYGPTFHPQHGPSPQPNSAQNLQHFMSALPSKAVVAFLP